VIRIELGDAELDFIGTVLGQLPTATTAQAGMLHLIPKLQQQAQQENARRAAEAQTAAKGVEEALS
jgi:hypothetical protein